MTMPRTTARNRLRRLIALMATLAVGLTLAVATGTAPAQASTQMTGSQFVEWSIGRTLGPNSYTDYGKGTITGWPDRIYRNTKVSPAIKIADERSRYTPIAPMGSHMNERATHYAPDGTYHPDSWYNPFSWDWGHILGSMWQHVKDCLAGAAGAFLPAMGGTTAVNILFRGGAKLYVGPAGYAAIAIGGCLGNIMG